jgi:hypothetical protein
MLRRYTYYFLELSKNVFIRYINLNNEITSLLSSLHDDTFHNSAVGHVFQAVRRTYFDENLD